jgi:cell wall assembly regulator SMI1
MLFLRGLVETIFGYMWSSVVTDEELWIRLERQFERHAPDLAKRLRPGANEADLAEFEKLLGQHLPDDVRFAYLRHDGCTYADALGLFNGNSTWVPIKDAINDWNDICESIEGSAMADVCAFDESDPLWETVAIRPFDYPPKEWIPLAQGSGRPIFIDLLPGNTGTLGQIIGQYVHSGSGDTWVVASSFRNYLLELLTGLESGSLIPMNEVGTNLYYWGNTKTNEPFQATSFLSVYPMA